MRAPASAARRRLLLAAGALPLGGCSAIPSWPWIGGGSGPKPTELSDFKATLSARVAWRTSVGKGGGLYLQPAVTENAVYAAAADGAVLRLAPDTGSQVWRVTPGGAISAGVGSDGGVVAVGTGRGELICLGTDGVVQWRAQLGSDFVAPPLVGRGIVVARTTDYRLVAFDAATGRRRWTFARNLPPLTLRAPSELALAGDLVLAGFPGGRLVALAAGNGAVRWDGAVSDPKGATEVERLNDVVGAPWVGGAETCAATFQGRIACFEVTSGTQAWARELSATSGVGGDARNVYVVDAKSEVVAFARSGGASVWRQNQLAWRRLSTPLATRQAVLVGDYAGIVHLLAPDTGAFAARVSLDGEPIVVAPRALAGGALVQTQGGTLALIEVAGG